MTTTSDDPLHQALCQALGAYPDAPLRLALSGGLDSALLLTLLAAEPEWRRRLVAVHVHHGLSPHADGWVAFCQARCDALGVPLVTERVRLVPGNGESLEAQAREARYEVLKTHLPAGGVLLTAHHGDDQLETLLLALKRGSGVRGLGAMRAGQPFGNGAHLRPWLPFSRQQLVAAAQRAGIAWVDDESNGDDRFDRNFLRLHLIPLLRERWPAILQTAGRSAELCAESSVLLDEVAAEDLQRTLCQEGVVIATLAELSPARRHNLLRYWLRQCGAVVPSREQLQRIWHEVACAREDANPALHWEGWSCRRHAGVLHLLRRSAGEVQRISWQEALTPGQPLTLPEGLGRLLVQASQGGPLRLPWEGESLSVRFDVPPGCQLHPVGRSGGRRLKKLWQEFGIPSWQRGRIPILYYGETPAAVLGLFICREFACEADTGLAWQWPLD
ncbi:tRNA(Ile)-lysidine synthetase [Aeromonas diversa CDC 2478-85]|uniref:tRNA(Ile)-lysidine synthase n=1 Tax=Aeromonas diversa CDC 2478-85 TaxID=1268237 RepID=N9U410_9GAMM|nr:tRNA lysidine(34) synthetase TilS [Aeromonas diversa]ENY73099.1 tRNA(Ile)-lysidine synthetase [Aeromonas diversa CDC 2478-85]